MHRLMDCISCGQKNTVDDNFFQIFTLLMDYKLSRNHSINTDNDCLVSKSAPFIDADITSLIVFSFWNYKRPNITERVVQRAFGKPIQTWTKKSKTFETINGSKSWEKRSVGKITAYRTKQKHTVWMYYDTGGKLRMFRLFEKVPK